MNRSMLCKCEPTQTLHPSGSLHLYAFVDLTACDGLSDPLNLVPLAGISVIPTLDLESKQAL